MLQLWLEMNTVRPSSAPSEDTQPPRPSPRSSDEHGRPGPSSSNDAAGRPRPSSWVGSTNDMVPRPSSSNDVVPHPNFSTSAAARPSRRLRVVSVRCACTGRRGQMCTRMVPLPWFEQGCRHCIDCTESDDEHSCDCNCMNCCDVSSRSSSERSRTPPTERATVSEPEAEPASSPNL